MTLKHNGTQEELTVLLKGIGITGQWIDGDPKEYHMNGGGKVRWWPKTHTVFVQGSPILVADTTARLGAAIAAKTTTVTRAPLIGTTISFEIKRKDKRFDLTIVDVRKP